MNGPREVAMQALLGVVTSAYGWTIAPARRLKLWSEVARAQRPAAFVFEGGNDTMTWSNPAVPKRQIEAKIFVYTDCHAPTLIGATQMNDILDALDTALSPSGADLALGRCTLGGAAYWCRIDGKTLKVPGDLDGDGILVIPITITLP